MTRLRIVLMLLFSALSLPSPANVDTPATPAPTPPPRVTVLISDTHLGVGHQTNGSWDPTEDARWPDAFEGFLNYVNTQYGSRVDLVILGDFLELWQPPAHIKCDSRQSGLGCTVTEMTELVTLVSHEHPRELAALTHFSVQGGNHVFVVPGNHDSALVLPEIWKVLESALKAPTGHITRVDQGIWTSTDGLIYAEHGHQIGQDVNRYPDWPKVTTVYNGVTYMVAPWGAHFVQSLYNEVEHNYPIIDNLGPESVGARYLMADLGVRRSAGDMAKFLIFNLFETSIRQKQQVLAAPNTTDPRAEWQVGYARTLGVELFKVAFDPDDPAQTMLSGTSDKEKAFQKALADALRDEQAMPAENVLQLCEHAAIHQHNVCRPKTSSAALQGLFNTKEQVIRAHLKEAHTDARLAFYVYGHTHQVETPWDLNVTSQKQVEVANTGAFQRLIDETTFKALIHAQNLDPKVALRSVKLEQLPACYSYVVVTSMPPKMLVQAWQQEEGKAGQPLRSLEQCKNSLPQPAGTPTVH